MAEERSQHGTLREIPALAPHPSQWVKPFIRVWSLNEQHCTRSHGGELKALCQGPAQPLRPLGVSCGCLWTGIIFGNVATLLGEPGPLQVVIWPMSTKLYKSRLVGRVSPGRGSYFCPLIQPTQTLTSELQGCGDGKNQTILQWILVPSLQILM